MIFVFEVTSPALSNGTPSSDLHGEEWVFEDGSRASADARAHRRLCTTFALASAERYAASSVRCVGEYESMQAYRRAREAA